MLRLRDIMTTDVVTVGPQATLREALDLFAMRRVSGAPVVDGGRVVGVVSASDLLAFQASTPPVPTATEEPAPWEEDAEPPGWESDDEPAARYFSDTWNTLGPDSVERFAETATPEWDLLAEHTVAEIMTRRVIALGPEAEVTQAADRMRRAEVHRVLVMEKGALVGLVTTTDIMRAVAEKVTPFSSTARNVAACADSIAACASARRR